MTPEKQPATGVPYAIPPEGSLGLLALGYRGLVAWRAVRGSEWLEERKLHYEAAVAARVAAKTAAAAMSDSNKSENVRGGARVRHLPPAVVLEDLSITIVSGLPRSGTSMMMQMLTAGGLASFSDDVRRADESNPRGYFEHEKVKGLAKDSTWIGEADLRAVKVVAPLLRYLPIGPEYRVLLMVRDIDEILRSQATMLAKDGRTSSDADVLKRAYERQMAEARRWISGQDRASMLEVEHQEVLSDPVATALAVNAFLGGELSEREMADVVEPSLHRARA